MCLTAIETGLCGTLRVTLKKGSGIARPWAETASHVITMAFDPDLDVAAQSALVEMIELIEHRSGLTAADAYTLCSIAADVHVTQLVNAHKGVHVMLAKAALVGHDEIRIPTRGGRSRLSAAEFPDLAERQNPRCTILVGEHKTQPPPLRHHARRQRVVAH